MEINNLFIDALSFDTEDLSQEQLQTQFNEFQNQVIEQVDAFENYSAIFRLLSDHHICLTSILELQKALNNKKMASKFLISRNRFGLSNGSNNS